MERAVIAFSFDDGRLDNYTNAHPILKKYHLPATFNITSGYIKNEIDREFFKFPLPMTESMVQELYADGHYEIAGHGCKHINTVEDIVTGIQDLCQMLHTEQLTGEGNGFASPGSDLTKEMYNGMKSVLDANHFCYVRISCRYKSHSKLKRYLRKASRIVKWPWIYKVAYQDTLMDKVEDNILYSIPVLSSVTTKQMKAVIQAAIEQKKVCVLMFHSIIPRESIRNSWDYPTDSFESICKLLSGYQEKKQLEVTTVMSAYSLLKK